MIEHQVEVNAELSQARLDTLVDQLVDFHQQAPPISVEGGIGDSDDLADIVADEFTLLEEHLVASAELADLKVLASEAYHRLIPLFEARHRDGYVRHRDVTALDDARYALLAGVVEPSAERRCHDVCSDLAALLVDLEAGDATALAHCALNRYLERSGDHGLVQVLSYYKLYRALVRARSVIVRQQGGDGVQPSAIPEEGHRYLALASEYACFTFPYLVIGVGVSGSGKSRFTGEMVKRLGGVRLSSHIERKRLFGIHPQADGRQQAVDIYTPAATQRTYQRLARLTGLMLESGMPVCIDATCLARWQRDMLCWEAEGRGLPVLIVGFEADEATLRRRIAKRARRSEESPAVSLAVLEQQQAKWEPFADDERRHLIHLDTTADNATETLVGLIQQHVKLI